MSSDRGDRRSTVVQGDALAIVVLVRGGAEVARWPLAGWDRPDLARVEELARMFLVARRLGYSIRLQEACCELLELLSLAGLSDLVLGAGRTG